jgi:hypothetical protein
MKTSIQTIDDARPHSRRHLLRGLALAPVAVAAGACTGMLLAKASEQDPIFAAIAAHKASRDHLNTLDSEDERWEPAVDVELAEWYALVDQVPTTLAGALAFAEYVIDYPDIMHTSVDDGALQAFKRLATALQNLVGGTHV